MHFYAILISLQYSNVLRLNFGLAGKEGEAVDIQVGDKLQMKKAHPCGNNLFEVLRIGADFKIRCVGCGREVMVPRHKCEHNIRKVLRESVNDEG